MNLFSFSWLSGNATPELPNIYPMPITEVSFVAIDCQNIYSRILTDVFERTEGLKDKHQKHLWDNCLASEIQDGLITMLAKAMVDKKDLFIVYIPNLEVLRLADQDETRQIKEGYGKKAEPVTLTGGGKGLYVSFQKYLKSDMLKFYSQLEYCSVGGLWKQGNIAKALQLKFKDLRGSVSLGDSADTKVQAQAIAKALGLGRDIMLDAEDLIELAKVDLTATEALNAFIAQKRSFYLGVPSSYLTGELTNSMGDTGKADTKAIERGLKPYFFSIAKPVAEGLFEIKAKFKSDDSGGVESGLNVLKTFDTTSSQYLSDENKTLIVNRAFGLPDDEVGDEQVEVEPTLGTDGKPLPVDPKAIPGQTSKVPAKPAVA